MNDSQTILNDNDVQNYKHTKNYRFFIGEKWGLEFNGVQAA